MLFFYIPLRHLPVQHIEDEMRGQAVTDILQTKCRDCAMIPCKQQSTFLFAVQIKENRRQYRYNSYSKHDKLCLPQHQHLVFLLLKQNPMCHQGRILLITQSQVCRTHPDTLIPDRIIKQVVPLQIVISPLVVAGFLVKLLKVFITDMYHIRVDARRDYTLGQ